MPFEGPHDHHEVTSSAKSSTISAGGWSASPPAAATCSIAVSSGALRIGSNSIWGEYFSGLIDEVRIYNRALTAAQIQQDMATPVNP